MRLILGDSPAMFLDALSTVLTQRGYDVGAVARSSDELITLAGHQQPDACLIDCRPATDEGVKTIRRVLEASEATVVVVVSPDADENSAQLALDAGASGYLHQSRGVDVLVAALERMVGGEFVIDVPDAGRTRPQRPSAADKLAATLTGREREVLSLLVAGLDTTAMMTAMGVSRTTVRTHLQAVLTKLCVHSRLEAASFAVRHHLVDAWTPPADTASAGTASAGTASAGTVPAEPDAVARPGQVTVPAAPVPAASVPTGGGRTAAVRRASGRGAGTAQVADITATRSGTAETIVARTGPGATSRRPAGPARPAPERPCAAHRRTARTGADWRRGPIQAVRADSRPAEPGWDADGDDTTMAASGLVALTGACGQLAA
jgi:two-component system nitrate/nitrite response regulator NarL